MQFKNVLVPYDESEHARSALHVAIGMVGGDPAATIHVVTVVSSDIVPPSVLSASDVFGSSMSSFENYEQVLSSVVERSANELRDSVGAALGEDMEGLSCKMVVDAYLAPSPVDGIEQYAGEHDCDLVVMGRRGLGALRGMLGSVSFGVLRSIDIPVMTVK